MAAPCIHPLLFKQFWTSTCMLQYPWESFNYQKDLWSLPKVFTLPMWFPYILLKWNTGGTLCHVFILQINFVVSNIILRKQRIGSCLTAILYVVLPSIPCFHSLTSVWFLPNQFPSSRSLTPAVYSCAVSLTPHRRILRRQKRDLDWRCTK